MKTIKTNWARREPKVTAAKLQKLVGTGTAYASEHSPAKQGVSLKKSGWREVRSFEELREPAAAGHWVWVKTASWYGRARFFVSASAEIAPDYFG